MTSDIQLLTYNPGVLTFRVGDPHRPRGHALVYFRNGDAPDELWAT
jgi:hypothetical protein